MFEPAAVAGLGVMSATGPAQWLRKASRLSACCWSCSGTVAPRTRRGWWPRWIGAAYWFTASTSFANPAITIARSLTNTFAGIRPVDMPTFIVAQLVGALAALAVARVLFATKQATVRAETTVAAEPVGRKNSETLNG